MHHQKKVSHCVPIYLPWIYSYITYTYLLLLSSSSLKESDNIFILLLLCMFLVTSLTLFTPARKAILLWAEAFSDRYCYSGIFRSCRHTKFYPPLLSAFGMLNGRVTSLFLNKDISSNGFSILLLLYYDPCFR